jgi:hypothetical protein
MCYACVCEPNTREPSAGRLSRIHADPRALRFYSGFEDPNSALRVHATRHSPLAISFKLNRPFVYVGPEDRRAGIARS